MIAMILAATLSVAVPENRAIANGRTIELKVEVIERSNKTDAIFIIGGGPGVAATGMAGYAQRTFAHTDHDIVLVDVRGTGGSNPLRCTMPGSDADPSGYFGSWLDLDAVAKCRTELEPRADLTQYTTAAIVEDLEAVRKKLGYKQMDLYGTSYGSRVAIELMRRYPKSVRTAILDGIVPPSMISPVTFAQDAERSMKLLFALCRNDAACQAAFPELESDYAKVMKDAEDGVEIEVPQRVTVGRGLFGEILRNFLYSPDVYVKLPLALHQAARGDWTLFTEMAKRYTRGVRGLHYGMFLSVVCAEDVPLIDLDSAKRHAAGTLLGTYRVEQQLAGCRLWPRGAADPNARKPIRSKIPTVIVSGELDPVTPPHWGDEVLRTLKNGKHVVIPNGSHSGDTGGCLEQVLSEFVKEGSVATLDDSCVAKIQRPSFITSGKN